MTKQKKQNQKGFALMVTIITILAVCIVIGIGLSFLIYNSILATESKIKSVQSYYTAEAGIEDSLFRIKSGLQTFSPNTLVVDSTLAATITIVDELNGDKTIVSQGSKDNRIRKVTATYTATDDEVNFFYGVQAGEGGILMNNNSQITGNVFSNGDILCAGSGKCTITGTAVVASAGNELTNANVGEDAFADICDGAIVGNDLHYVTAPHSCSVTGAEINEAQPEDPQDLPISQAQISEWKIDAAAGGSEPGDYSVPVGTVESLGPKKINGNLRIEENATLTLTGTIYVVGDITIDQNSTLQLDNGYGTDSGVILCDGKAQINNNTILQGSGDPASYIMVLSTNASVDPADPAINVVNNALGAIFYASEGGIVLNNNINIREATGYKLILNPLAVVEYESGLANLNFTSGPGGGWLMTNWQEIE